ncbi:ABC transporter permease, partial [Oligoflexia bacterium]|nr:ABC transporter permease [Oligoflexia bacterium]
MGDAIYNIPILNLLLVLSLVFVVIAIHIWWSMKAGTVLYGVARMLLQLTLIGYVLTFIFESDNPILIGGVLCFMLVVASWIALRPLSKKRKGLYTKVLFSITVGGTVTLLVVTQGVLGLTPWYEPHYLIPLAGMIFSNAMNAVSLAAERFEAELERGGAYLQVRNTAMQAALIPITNSLFAVGLVSLPGMMTGQILSGVSPLIAARYQIMVMCMVFGSAGISVAIYLSLLRERSCTRR